MGQISAWRGLILALGIAAGACAPARASLFGEAVAAVEGRTYTTPETSQLEVAFSPDGGATALVIKAIDSARQSLELAGYSFTSRPIAQALIAARRRGVNVRVVLDKSQRTERYSSATFLANMGVPVRIDSRYRIMHNKFLIVDGRTVETGSFNYTYSAQHYNAENVLVVWNNPRLARIYAATWRGLWGESSPYYARY